jgi:hypothetical protein
VWSLKKSFRSLPSVQSLPRPLLRLQPSLLRPLSPRPKLPAQKHLMQRHQLRRWLHHLLSRDAIFENSARKRKPRCQVPTRTLSINKQTPKVTPSDATLLEPKRSTSSSSSTVGMNTTNLENHGGWTAIASPRTISCRCRTFHFAGQKILRYKGTVGRVSAFKKCFHWRLNAPLPRHQVWGLPQLQ